MMYILWVYLKYDTSKFTHYIYINNFKMYKIQLKFKDSEFQQQKPPRHVTIDYYNIIIKISYYVKDVLFYRTRLYFIFSF